MQKNQSTTLDSSKKNLSAKKKKAKTTLANPFTLEWPSVDADQKSAIIKLLGSVISSAGTLRKDSCIYGYNAVMRALEQSRVSAVFVNAKAKPFSLIQSFIPICTIRSIPVINVDTLNEITKTSNIKSCLALALTREVIRQDNPFHDLYISCCNLFSSPPGSSDDTGVSHVHSSKTIQKLSDPVITNGSFRLKRSSKSYRVFHPGVAETTASRNDDVILFNKDPEEQQQDSFVGHKRKIDRYYKEASVKRIKKNENRKS